MSDDDDCKTRSLAGLSGNHSLLGKVVARSCRFSGLGGFQGFSKVGSAGLGLGGPTSNFH